MKQVKYLELVIISDLEKSAKRFPFGLNKNLILGSKNNVGKTCLSTSMLWALGADIRQQSSWKKLKVRTVIKLDIYGDIYFVARDNNETTITYPSLATAHFLKISDYAIALAAIINFEACIKSKNSTNVSTPYPSIQLLKSYIHQDAGWSESFKSFNTGMYAKPEIKKIIEYFVGIKPAGFFEPLFKSAKLNGALEELKSQSEKIETVRNVVTSFRASKFDELSFTEYRKQDYNSKIDSLIKKEIDLKDQGFELKKVIFEQKKQVRLISKAESELFKDYQFATNEVEGQSVNCPTCGTEHRNNVIDRFQLIDDREQLIDARKLMQKDIAKYKAQLDGLNHELAELRNLISIEKMYSNTPEHLEQMIVENSMGHFDSMLGNVFEQVTNHNSAHRELLEEEIRGVGTFKKNKIYREKVKSIKQEFRNKLRAYLEDLAVEDVDGLEEQQLLYSFDVSVSGSDVSRAILAYYRAITDISSKYCAAYTLPMVIDTPLQQEQDIENLTLIVGFLSKWNDQQLFLFGSDQQCYDEIKSDSYTKVTLLTARKRLLSTENYIALASSYDRFFSL
ncbi:MAG: hypothetical protein HRT35_06160 [Algicola sp.]|nr:hypothetical protein [Algicola sp.]